jgi:hypothetical protein
MVIGINIISRKDAKTAKFALLRIFPLRLCVSYFCRRRKVTDQVQSYEKSAEEHRKIREKIQAGGIATKIRILANHDNCPVCRRVEGAYDFDDVPELPLEGCSHPMGCRCYYAPVLDRRGP